MLIIGNSHVSVFDHGIECDQESIKVKWVGALSIDWFFNHHPGAEKICSEFDLETGWKVLFIGNHDMHRLLNDVYHNDVTEAFAAMLDKYQKVFLELNKNGKFAWAISVQQTKDIAIQFCTEKDFLQIVKEFNQQLTQWCLTQNIPVLDAISKISSPAGLVEKKYLQVDELHFKPECAYLYLDDLSLLSGLNLSKGTVSYQADFPTDYEPGSFASLILRLLNLPSIQKQELDIKQFTAQVKNFSLSLLVDKGIDISSSESGDALASSYFDSLSLVEIYTFASNLCGNAVNFNVDLYDYQTIEDLCHGLHKQMRNQPAYEDFVLSFIRPWNQQQQTLEAEQRIRNMPEQLASQFDDAIYTATQGNVPYGIILFWQALMSKSGLEYSLKLLNDAANEKIQFPIESPRYNFYLKLFQMGHEKGGDQIYYPDQVAYIDQDGEIQYEGRELNSELKALASSLPAIREKIELGYFQESENIITQSLEKFPEFVDLIFLQALLFFKQQKLAETEETLTRLENLWSYHAEGYFLKYQLLSIKGQKKLADTALNFAFRVDPQLRNIKAAEFNQQGEQFFSEKRFDEAEKLFKQAIDINPNSYEGLNNLGVLETERDRLDDAFPYLFNAYKLDPNNKLTLINFSTVLRALNKNNEADEILSLYLDSNPEDQEIHQLLKQDQEEQLISEKMQGEQGYVISAIVSTYDSDQFIAGRLDDLLSQTLADKVEIIVIDSCSPGKEQQIVIDYQQRYSNIKYLRTDTRETIYQAWNRGIKLSAARYITNANTDDRLRPDALEIMVNALKNNSDVALVYADYFITTAPIQNFNNHVRSGHCVRPDFHPSIMNSGCHMGPQPVWRKEIHSHLGYFDESYRSSADYEFWCRIATRYPMLHINEFLGLYYHNPVGIVNSNAGLSVKEAQHIQQKYTNSFPMGNAVPVPDFYYPQPWQDSEYVNIGMVTYNRLEFTKQAIESLVTHTRFPHAISVVDNNSQDGTQQYLTKLHEQGVIKNLVLLKENIGVAKACNLAWQCEPEAGYYLKYDNDIIVQKPDWLKNLVEVANGVRQLGVVGYSFEPVSYELKIIDGFKIRPKSRGANVGGACILIPKKTHDRLGFWCEDYGLYGEEDFDYGVRVTLSGLLNVYMEDEDIGFHLPAGKAAAIDQHSFVAKDGLEESLDKAYREAKDEHRAKNMAPDGPVKKNLQAYQNHPDRLYVTTTGLTNDIFNLVLPESLKEQILNRKGQQQNPLISGDEGFKGNDLDLIQKLSFASGPEAASQVLLTIAEITDDSVFNTAVTASASNSKFLSKYAVTKDELFLQLAEIVKDKAIEKVEHDQGLLNQALHFLYAIDHQSVYFEKSISLKAIVRQLLDDLQYQYWIINHSLLEVDAELFAERMMLKWQSKPSFHLLMLLFPEEQALLAETLDSLGKQFYQEWGLTVISELPVPDPIFEQEDFLNWVQVTANDDPYELLNALISDVESDWVAIIEPGATFEQQAFIQIADYINIKPKWKLIYTDEDRLEKDESGNVIRTAANFKPDFNLDLLRSTPYMGRFCVVERAGLIEMGGFSADFGLENFDAAFRYYENYGEQSVGHISDVLFHQPAISNRHVAEEQIQNIVKRHLQRNSIDADVGAGYLPESCRVTYQHQQVPKVSIIIPNKDKLEYLEPCIETLLGKTEYPNYEVIIVDNQSSDPDVVEYYSVLKQRHPEKMRVIDYPHAFNFSAICNYAADQAEGEYLLLLNNDTEILHKEWLGRMMMHAMRDDVGVVGARLVYPESGLLQHAGIVMGMDTIADHPFIGQLHIKESGYMGRALLDQNYSAVTGACLLIEKNIYQSVKGMDEEKFAVSYNDVDLCLKTREAGYRVVWTPYATLVHHGNVTQNSTAVSKEKIERFKSEREAMFEKWQTIISDDPAFNRQLSLTNRDFSIEAAMPCNWDVNFHDRLRVFGIPMEGGAGDYRLIQPFNGLRKSGFAQCEYLRLQRGAKDRISISEIARQKPDVVVFHSSITDSNLELLEQCKMLLPDVFLIYMIDDLIDQVPEKSSAYRTLKRSFRDAKPRIRKALSNCDRVIVSTEPLAKFCRGMINDIKIVPNSLERDVWLGLESKRQQGNKLRVGWAGALQHQGDLEMIVEVVKQTASEVDWIFMGMCPESIKPYIKEFQESVDISDYPKVLAGLNLDLAIAPLEENSFNEAKSNLRILEYGILGWPVICSDVYPYRGAPVTCVENTTESWLAAIRQAIHYPDNLPKQGDALCQWVTTNYLLEDNLDRWLEALKPKS